MPAKDVAFEKRVARKFLAKMYDAEKRGLEFTLSLKSIENLMKAEYCYYTGFKLTEPKSEEGSFQIATDRTIDRIDASKGYVKGNVVACSFAANQLKSMCEGGGIAGYKMGERVFRKTLKRIQETQK